MLEVVLWIYLIVFFMVAVLGFVVSILSWYNDRHHYPASWNNDQYQYWLHRPCMWSRRTGKHVLDSSLDR